MVNEELITKKPNSWKYYKAGIFNDAKLQNKEGRYKGYPHRTFSSGRYVGGYSDHFPVYIYLVKEY
ncbi:MAG: hypothetical protein HRT66_05850 [Flavobacteriaceae bacterium]|nr:hypothetical protein [Flavobacteriaceae bacterium]